MNYVWHDNQVIELEDVWEAQQKYPRDYLFTRNKHKPFGFFSGNGYWIPVEPDKVPKEFKTALLLLGVT